jgi:hypothetical protein
VNDYIIAPVLAKRLGLKTATLARWRRSKAPVGPQGWIRFSASQVAYPLTSVEEWISTRAQVTKQPFVRNAA